MADGIMKILPEDVVIFILLRLPVKFLLRFKCVSKTWHTCIQYFAFINLHLKHTTSKDEYILLKRSFKEDIESYNVILSFLSGASDCYLDFIYPDLNVPDLTASCCIDYDILIGPSHGLIALMDAVTTIVFNPSTKIHRLLPPSPSDAPKGFYRTILSGGFGFDSIVNDYKVIKIFEDYTEDPYGYLEYREKQVEVYELGIDIWRELDHVDQLPMLFWLTSSISYEGVYHWIATVPEDLVIFCFDMSTEIFRNIKTPDVRHHSNGTLHKLLLLNESLSLTCPTNDLIDIWIMKDYNVHESWVKKYTIRGISTEPILAVWKDYLLLFEGQSGHLMSYDLNSDEVKELNLKGCLKSLRVVIFKESLTPIPRGCQCSTQVQNF